MWGSTTPNTLSECTWTKAPFNGGASSYDSGYFNSVKNTVCPNNVLAKEYDTATRIMGSDWRMPTEAECQELKNNTTSVWTTINGVYGRKFISKTNESKYIFIPAAGYCDDGSVVNVGYTGIIWSSSLRASLPSDAWSLNFYSDNCFMSSSYRYYGQPVRGVRK